MSDETCSATTPVDFSGLNRDAWIATAEGLFWIRVSLFLTLSAVAGLAAVSAAKLEGGVRVVAWCFPLGHLCWIFAASGCRKIPNAKSAGRYATASGFLRLVPLIHSACWAADGFGIRLDRELWSILFQGGSLFAMLHFCRGVARQISPLHSDGYPVPLGCNVLLLFGATFLVVIHSFARTGRDPMFVIKLLAVWSVLIAVQVLVSFDQLARGLKNEIKRRV